MSQFDWNKAVLCGKVLSGDCVTYLQSLFYDRNKRASDWIMEWGSRRGESEGGKRYRCIYRVDNKKVTRIP